MRHEGGLENCLKAAIKSREATCFTCRPGAVEPWETKQTALKRTAGVAASSMESQFSLEARKGKVHADNT